MLQEIPTGKMMAVDDEREWAVISYFILRLFADKNDPRRVQRFLPLQGGDANFDDHLEQFNGFYLDP